MGPIGYFFSFEGRIRRTHWWLASLALVFVPLVIIIAMIMTIMSRLPEGLNPEDEAAVRAWAVSEFVSMGPLYLIAIVLGLLVMIVSQLSLNMRRYHDRGKSGWWVLLGWTPLIFSVLAAMADNSPALYFVGVVLTLVVPIWQLIELGFLGGTPGSNDFGPDPRGGLGNIAGEIAAMRGGVPAGGKVWSNQRDDSPAYRPVTVQTAAHMPMRSGPPAFGKRH